jgi:hypothetical protein
MVQTTSLGFRGSTLHSQLSRGEDHGIVVVTNLQMDRRNVEMIPTSRWSGQKSSSDTQALKEILHGKLVKFHLKWDRPIELRVEATFKLSP